MSSKPESKRRFRVALSFPGEHREYVKQVDRFLTAALNEDAVFYDDRYQHELARIDLDTHLQHIYGEDADLIVVFLCREYEKKEWCRLEWRAIRDIIKRRREEDVMPFRFDDAHIPGVFSTDGYIDAMKTSAEIAAQLIRKRLDTRTHNGLTAAVEGPQAAEPTGTASRRVAVWNMPHPRNPNFTGREELLSDLRSALCAGVPTTLTQADEGSAVPQAMTGLGGVGKTQTAIEYAYRHRTDYSLIWWLRSEEPLTLVADYAALSCALGTKNPTNATRDEICRIVKNSLEHGNNWLLIFDNVPHPDSVRDYVPACTGHVLITSRDPNWRRDAQPLKVPEWPRAESLTFLSRRTGRKHDPHSDMVAGTLGDFPLALEQAAAYIEETGISFKDYVELFKKHRARLLNHGKPYGRREGTVTTTWDISLGEAARICPAAADLLALISFLAPEQVPLSLLCPYAEVLPPRLAETLADEYATSKAVAALRRFSLIEVDQNRISAHRLVQAVTRDRIEGEQASQWADGAVKLVNAAFPLQCEDASNWAVCAQLTRHGLAASAHAQLRGAVGPHTVRLLSQIGVYLRTQACFQEARDVLETAVKAAEQTYGVDNPEIAPVVNNLGCLLHSLAELEAAKCCYEKALRVSEAAGDSDKAALGSMINNLGGILHSLGHFDQAKQCYERALRISEAAYGSEHAEVATIINNLGRLLHDSGDLAEAKAWAERALQMDERVCGPDHPNVARDANNLGRVLQDLGDLERARSCYERAVRIDEMTHGPYHPAVGTGINNLGMVLHSLYDLPAAKTCFKRALRISEAAYGQKHPQVAVAVNNLGNLLRDLGDYVGAKACIERAIRIDEAAYGTQHPEVGTDVGNLGRILQLLGDLSGARACHERAVGIHEAAYGRDHPKLATGLSNLGSVLRELGDAGGAKACYERALRIDEATYGSDHLTVAMDLNNLGFVLRSLGDTAGAKACIGRALRINEAAFGSDHPQVAVMVSNLAYALKDSGDLLGAKGCIERALRIHEQAFGPHHPTVAKDVSNLGILLKELGDLKGAQAAFERALRIFETSLGPDNQNTKTVSANLAALQS